MSTEIQQETAQTDGTDTAPEVEAADTGIETGDDAGDDVTSPDDAALATIQNAFDANDDDDTGEEAAPDAGASPTTEPTPEAIEPDLLTAASFAGLSEQDLRDTIGAIGKDKTITAIRTIIERASAQWAPQETGQPQQQAAPQQQAQPKQAATPPPANDPLAQYEADNFGEELVKDFPEAKPVVEANRNLAKAYRALESKTEKLVNFISSIVQQQDNTLAADIFDFYSDTDPQGSVYGNPNGAPTPEQLAKRQRLVEGARAYQQRAGVPMRFSRALKETHAALNLGTPTKPATPTTTNKPKTAPAAKPKGDLTPSSPGKAPGKLSNDQQRDQAAMATLKKYGFV